MTLVMGNRNYSSWSMRAWLALEQTGCSFEERVIWFDEDGDRRKRLAVAPPGRVPVLLHGRRVVWDSLAIVEYLAELFPEAGLWPAETTARARARSLCCEMHAGFFEIRNRMPLNCRARKEPRDRGPEVRAEIEMMTRMWSETRHEFGAGGPFLFGERSAADAYFAPVASRFRTYAVALEGESARYASTLLDLAPVRAWLEAAERESHPDPEYDRID
jgi:glutathione S-transferase